MTETFELELFSKANGTTKLICASVAERHTIALVFHTTSLEAALSTSQLAAIAEWYAIRRRESVRGQIGDSRFLSLPSLDGEPVTLTAMVSVDGLDLALSRWIEDLLNPRKHREIWLDPEQAGRFAAWIRQVTRTEVTR